MSGIVNQLNQIRKILVESNAWAEKTNKEEMEIQEKTKTFEEIHKIIEFLNEELEPLRAGSLLYTLNYLFLQLKDHDLMTILNDIQSAKFVGFLINVVQTGEKFCSVSLRIISYFTQIDPATASFLQEIKTVKNILSFMRIQNDEMCFECLHQISNVVHLQTKQEICILLECGLLKQLIRVINLKKQSLSIIVLNIVKKLLNHKYFQTFLSKYINKSKLKDKIKEIIKERNIQKNSKLLSKAADAVIIIEKQENLKF